MPGQEATTHSDAPGEPTQKPRVAAPTDHDGPAWKRVAELTEVNRLLVESMLRLTSGADPEAFLESLVRTISDRIGASPVSLFEFDPDARTLTLRILYQNGQTRRGPSGAEVPLFAAPFPVDLALAPDESVRDRRPTEAPTRHTHACDCVWPGIGEWFGRIGVSETAYVVLSVGDEPVGSLGLAWTDGRTLDPADRPQVEALAQQAAAVLRLVKFADRDREAAVAREQEKAARDRVAELARANDALQRSTALLIRNEEPIPLLEAVLHDAAEACGAAGAGVVQFDAAADTLTMVAWVRHGERVDLVADPRMAMWRKAYPASVTPGWDATVENRLLWFDNDQHGHAWPPAQAWHRVMGHRMIAIIPLLVSRRPLGYLKLCFEGVVPPTPSRIDQTRTLAGHAALALQLTRLTDELRREAAAAAALGERNRIARDLHDTLAQGFSGVLAQLGVIEGALDAGEPVSGDVLHHALGRAAALARSSLVEARRSVGLIRGAAPPERGVPPLGDGLRAMLDGMAAGTRLHVRVDLDPALPDIPQAAAEAVRRIAQEAMTNALKHAGPDASAFVLRLASDAGRLRLSVRDNGRGFTPPADGDSVDGFGLIGMRERAALAGGTMRLTSAPGQGVAIDVDLPLSAVGVMPSASPPVHHG